MQIVKSDSGNKILSDFQQFIKSKNGTYRVHYPYQGIYSISKSIEIFQILKENWLTAPTIMYVIFAAYNILYIEAPNGKYLAEAKALLKEFEKENKIKIKLSVFEPKKWW